MAESRHSIILSDIHLADAEPPHPRNPLWKRFKRRAHFVDPAFRKFVDYLLREISEPKELILNGDIFDFDSVMRIPKRGERPEIHVSWLERARGLFAEEEKSRLKLQVILDDHRDFVAALRDFVAAGNELVFVVGNHDLELHWPSVRKTLLDALDLSPEARARVRFCDWFYVSGGDTLIEHGHQYDAYSLSANPINPLIKKGGRYFMRIPFGNLAGRYMLNGMGLMNPHANSSFIKDSFWEYVKFYFKYVMGTQPLIMWTYLWSAAVTLFYSLEEGFLPAVSDPLTFESRVRDIAQRANATPAMVLALREMHAHPAIHNPIRIARELWLDRVFLLALLIFASFQVFVLLHWLARVSAWWFVGPLVFLLPFFIFYARSVNSEVSEADRKAFDAAPLAAQICAVKRVIQGHTHLERHVWTQAVEYLNTGTWSYAYRDVECTESYGRRCFAWVRPRDPRDPMGERVASLHEWHHGEATLISASGT